MRDRVDAIEPADVVIVATKATQNGAIVDQVRAAVRADSVLLIAQNGVDHLERFAVEANVVPAIVMLPSERIGPGQAKVESPSRLVIPDGQAAARVQSIFKGSFIDIEVAADWTSAAWLKLMMNAAVGGIGVLGRSSSTGSPNNPPSGANVVRPSSTQRSGTASMFLLIKRWRR
jgi:2-dehydropantoate 2-reductase